MTWTNRILTGAVVATALGATGAVAYKAGGGGRFPTPDPSSISGGNITPAATPATKPDHPDRVGEFLDVCEAAAKVLSRNPTRDAVLRHSQFVADAHARIPTKGVSRESAARYSSLDGHADLARIYADPALDYWGTAEGIREVGRHLRGIADKMRAEIETIRRAEGR